MLVGCMALAALGAGAIFDIGSSTAEAAKSASPFAGTYSGAFHSTRVWKVTISDEGLIASSYSIGGGRGGYGRMRGKISADGSYSIDVVTSSGREGSSFEYKSWGAMALDPAGNIVGKEKKGQTSVDKEKRVGSFVWLRQ
jgi:hypothetical protein